MLFFIYLIFPIYCFSQGTLYVKSYTPSFSVNEETSDCRISDYRNRYDISHSTGIYSIANNNVDVSISFEEGYNDDPGTGCSGQCGQFQWQGPEIAQQNMNYFEAFILNFSGPSNPRCAWNLLFEEDISQIPIDYKAIFMPNISQSNDIGICKPIFDNTIGNNTSLGGEVVWEYFDIVLNDWFPLPQFSTVFPLDRSIIDIFGDNYIDFIGNENTFPLRYNVFQNDHIVHFVIDIKNCSPEWQNTTKTDATCNQGGDGSVTLTFDRNVDTGSGYEMRYFLYEGDPATFPQARLTDINQPVITGVQVISDPFITLNAGFEGTYSGLSKGEYFIVYQEVKYDRDPSDGTDPPIVKSGEITPQFVIDHPTPITLNTSDSDFFTDANCDNPAIFLLNNTASGGNNLNASGTYGYEYSLDTGLTWLPVTGLNKVLEIPATTNPQSVEIRGVYTVNSAVCEGRRYTYAITAVANPIVITNPSTSNTSTITATDGSVEINFSGTGTTFTYILSRLNTATNTYEEVSSISPNVFIIPGGLSIRYSTLTAGTYQITVTDASGCPQTSPDLVLGTDPVPTLGTPIITPIGCTGTAGSISVPVSDFNTSYRYQWSINGALGAITSGSFADLELNNITAEATYSIRVSNARVSDTDFGVDLNVAIETIVMASPAVVTIDNAIPNDALCNGGNDGNIVLTISGGTTYEYALGNTPTTWLPLAGNAITGLSAGTYSVTVRNQNNCESETRTNIIIGEPDAIVIEEVSNSRQDVSVNGGDDGAIEISVSGGTAPYTFNWSGPNGFIATQQNPSGLSTGNYTLTVTDANNCPQNFGPIFINEPGPLGIASLIPTQVTCRGAATGSITAVVNGTPPLQFVWTKGGDASFTAPNQASITGLTAGTYTLSLTDASGDPAETSSVIINEPLEFLGATATTNATSCASLNDGQITLNTTGGTAPYRYSLNGSATQNSTNFNALSAGDYTITVFDANDCEFVINSITVSSATAIAITTNVVLNVSESGQSDGAISTSITGGTLPYSFSWSGPNGFTATTKDITNLAEGIYMLSVTDANNCTASQAFTITEPSELTISATQSLFLECQDDDYAEIVVTVTGGIPNYSYQWFQIENGSNNQLNETSNILANLSAGSYFVVVTDANNVSRTSNTISVTEPDILNVSVLTKVDVLCYGETTGSIQMAVSGGTSPYTFYWNGEVSTQNLSNLAAGDYFLEVIDANGCSEDLAVTVAAPTDPLSIQDAIITNASDYQATDGSLSIAIAGGAPNYSFEWTRIADNFVIGNQSSISNLTAGFYEVVITDANTCAITEIYEITQPDRIEETITNPTCAGLADGSISLLVNRGNGNFTYSWSTGATTNTITNLAAGTYTVTISGFDTPETRSYIVEEPLPILVDLGGDRVLCKGQNLELDATVENANASYTWTSDTGFSSSSPIVTLSEKGNYTVSVSSNGNCTQTSTIFVDVSDQEISAEFAVSSQVYAGETLILVDISFPIPDSMEWIIPTSAQILKQNKDEAEIVFTTPGEYEVGMITQRGSCSEIQTKKILVLAKDPTVTAEDTQGGNKLVEDFIIYPNPTSGEFTAQVDLTDRGNISIKVFSFTNNMLIASEKARGESSYTIPFNIANMPAGVYAVVLETPFGSTLRKIIVR
tara:strand:+ start:19039 stop:23973 length:4935 start_codon:yes stop_codon:yes gene_type:complete